MFRSWLAALLLTLFQSAAVATGALTPQRLAGREAVQFHARLHPGHLCADGGGEWHTDVVAFPAGRADRIYLFEMGAAWAFQIRSGRARLIWCGQAVGPSKGGWHPTSNVLRALVVPLRTVAGTLPSEGAMDILFRFPGHLTSKKLNSAGRVICSKERFDEGEFRTAFQFDARDTCP